MIYFGMCCKKVFVVIFLVLIVLTNISCSNNASTNIQANLTKKIVNFLGFPTDWISSKNFDRKNPIFLEISQAQKKFINKYFHINKNINKKNIFSSIQTKIIERIYIVFHGRDIIAVSSVNENVLILKTNGTVLAFGNNDYGQCNVKKWESIIAIGVGSLHAAGLRADGTVVATGNNDYGQCNVEKWKDIIAIGVGNLHTVGLKADGTVVAVGNNYYGQCKKVKNWKSIIKIKAGEWYTMGLQKDKTLLYAGCNKEFN